MNMGTGRKKDKKLKKILSVVLTLVIVVSTISSNQIFTDASSTQTSEDAGDVTGVITSQYSWRVGGSFSETFTAPGTTGDLAIPNGQFRKVNSVSAEIYLPANTALTLSPSFYQGLTSLENPTVGGVQNTTASSGEQQTITNNNSNAKKVTVTFDISDKELYVQAGEYFSVTFDSTPASGSALSGTSFSVYPKAGISGSDAIDASGQPQSGASIISLTYGEVGTPSEVRGIDVGQSEKTIDLQDTAETADLTVGSTDGINRRAAYTSSDPNVCAVDPATGALSPQTAGDVTITASVGSGAAMQRNQETIHVVDSSLPADGSYTYNGKAQTPEVTVRSGSNPQGAALGPDGDSNFAVTYSNNTNAGTANVTVAGKTGTVYAGYEKTLSFTISSYDISAAGPGLNGFDASNAGIVRSNGTVHVLSGVTDQNGNTLQEGTDFTVNAELAPNGQETDGATYNITLTGTGNYTGTTAPITKKINYGENNTVDINDLYQASVDGEDTYQYTGDPIMPGYTISFRDGTTAGDSTDLRESLEGTAYTISYVNNTNAGEASIVLQGIEANGYSGTIEIPFTIAPRDLAESYVNDFGTDSDHEAQGSVNLTLSNGKTVTHASGSDEGALTMEGSLPWSRNGVTLQPTVQMLKFISDGTTAGSKNAPVTLTEGSEGGSGDYSISYSHNAEIGTAQMTVTGQGNYTGELVVSYRLVGTFADDLSIRYNSKNITKNGGTFAIPSTKQNNKTYDGTAQRIDDKLTLRIDGTTLKAGTDYQAIDESAYQNNVNAGTGTLTITGMGDYAGQTATVTFTIDPLELTAQNTTMRVTGDVLYSGKEAEPPLSQVSVTIRGVKDENGNSSRTQTADQWGFSYGSTGTESGSANGRLSCSDVNAGEATLSLTGSGNFKTSSPITARFTIEKLPINDSNLTITYPQTVAVTGDPVEPAVEVRAGGSDGVILSGGSNGDYEITYADDHKTIGQHEFVISARKNGNLTGQITKYFRIVSRTMDNLTVQIGGQTVTTKSTSSGTTVYSSDYSMKYTGDSLLPLVTLSENGYTLSSGTDYFATYSSNVNPGTARVRFTGRGRYAGSTAEVTFKIEQRDISDQVSLDEIKAEFNNSGKLSAQPVLKNNAAVTSPALTEGTDFTVETTPAEITSAGSYSMTITGQGGFTGSRTETFSVGEDLSDASVTSVALENPWKTDQVYQPDSDGNYSVPYFGTPGEEDAKFNGGKLVQKPKTALSFTNLSDTDTSKKPVESTDGGKTGDYTITYKVDGQDATTQSATKDASVYYQPGTTVTVTIKATDTSQKCYGERSFTYTIRPLDLASAGNTMASGNAALATQNSKTMKAGDVGQVVVTDTNWTDASNKSSITYVRSGDAVISRDDTNDDAAGRTYYYNGKEIPIRLAVYYYPGGSSGPRIVVPGDELSLYGATSNGSVYTPDTTRTISAFGPAVTENVTTTENFDVVCVTGSDASKYTGQIFERYQIQPADLSKLYNRNKDQNKLFVDLDTTDDGDGLTLPYTGTAPTLSNLSVKAYAKSGDSSVTLTNGTDYTYTITPAGGSGSGSADLTAPGNYTLNLTGQGNFTNTASIPFTVASKQLTAVDAYIGSVKQTNTASVTADGGTQTAVKLPDQTYTGNGISLDNVKQNSQTGFSLKDGNTSLAVTSQGSGADGYYATSLTDQTYPGTAVVKLTGTGLYNGSVRYVTYHIVGDISDALTSSGEMSANGLFQLDKGNLKTSYTYDYDDTGEASLPNALLTAIRDLKLSQKTNADGNPKALTSEGSTPDYTVNTASLMTPGNNAIVLTGTGDYTGTLRIPVTMKGDISKATVTWTSGSAVVPYGETADDSFIISLNGVILQKDTDFTMSGDSVQDIGHHTVTLTGTGNFTGTKQVEYDVKYNLAYTTITVDTSNGGTAYQNGKQVTPRITVTYRHGSLDHDVTLADSKGAGSGEDVDFYTSYGENRDAGNGSVTISAVKDGSTSTSRSYGSKTQTFTIGAIKLFGDQDADVVFDGNTSAIGKIADRVYTGAAIQPLVTSVTPYGQTAAIDPTEYTVSYKDNINAGTATVTIAGKGNYTGSKDYTFTIQPKDFDNQDSGTSTGVNDVVFTKTAEAYYAGKYGTPSPTYAVTYNGVTLQEGTDFSLTSQSTQSDGMAGRLTFTALKGTGKNFKGSHTETFSVLPRDIETNGTYTFENHTTYTGKDISEADVAKMVHLTVDVGNGKTQELTPGEDYEVTFDGRTSIRDAGTYNVNIHGILEGKLTGWIQTAFTIDPKDISDKSVTAEIADQAYTGSAVTPSGSDVKVVDTEIDKNTPLAEGTDYTLTGYGNNVNAASKKDADAPTVTISGTGNYTGTRQETFNLGTELTKDEVSIAADPEKLTYNGQSQTPSVIVTRKSDGAVLTENTDYTTSTGDTDTVNAGKDKKITVRGAGGYYGTMTVSYEIEPMALEGGRIRILINDLSADRDRDGYAYTTYTGKEIQPKDLTVYYDANKNGRRDDSELVLNPDSDYKITGYANNKDVSTKDNPALVKIRLLSSGNYSTSSSSEQTGAFRILPTSLNDLIADQKYQVSLGDASIRDTDGKEVGTEAREDGKEAGTYGWYAYNYGNSIWPEVVFTDNNDDGAALDLKEGRDYEVSYSTAYMDANGNLVPGQQTLDAKDTIDAKSTTPNRTGYMVAEITAKEGADYTVSEPIYLPYVIYADLSIPTGEADNPFDVSVTVGDGGDQLYNYGNPIRPLVTVKAGGHSYQYRAGDTTSANDLSVTESSSATPAFGVGTEGTINISSNVVYFTGSASKDYGITNSTDSVRIVADNVQPDADGTIRVPYKGTPYDQSDLGLRAILPSGDEAAITGVEFTRQTDADGKKTESEAPDRVTAEEIASGTNHHDANDTHTGAGTVGYTVYFTVNGSGETLKKSSDDQTFTISPATISNTKVTFMKSNTYTGKEVDPLVRLVYADKTLKKNRDYTVRYLNAEGVESDLVQPGTYTVEITGKGNYTGTNLDSGSSNVMNSLTVYPDIPRQVRISDTDKRSITLSWNPANHVDGYYVRYQKGSRTIARKTKSTTMKISGLDEGTLYTFQVGSYVGNMASDDPTIRYRYGTVSGYTGIGTPADPSGSGTKGANGSQASITMNNANYDGFVVYRASSLYGNYTVKAIVPAVSGPDHATTFNDDTVKSGRTYYYRIAGYQDHNHTNRYADFDISGMSSPIAVSVQ